MVNKKTPYWVKAGIIAIILLVILFLITLFIRANCTAALEKNCYYNPVEKLIIYLSYVNTPIEELLNLVFNKSESALLIPLYLIAFCAYYFLIGALVAYIYRRIVGKKSEIKIKRRKK